MRPSRHSPSWCWARSATRSGTALGGVVYGVCYMLVQTYLSSWADLLPYVLLILILLLRPSGLLGRRVRVA